MVIIKVMGGLGNQMFQYALGKSIEKQTEYAVKYDISYFFNIPEGDTKREVYIERFICVEQIATKEEIGKIVGPDYKLVNRMLKKVGLYKKHVYHEKADGIQSIAQVQDNSYLIGYWQSEEYFSAITNEIRTMFDFSKFDISDIQSVLKQIELTEVSASIHVRGGDYLLEQNKKIFGDICTSQYYQNAYKRVKEEFPEAKFYMFTNDVAWTKTHVDLPYEEITIISEGLVEKEDWVELYLMSKCNINIVANSSYSWWAAWLNQHDDKVVISPPRWTNSNLDDKIICVDWLRINET